MAIKKTSWEPCMQLPSGSEQCRICFEDLSDDKVSLVFHKSQRGKEHVFHKKCIQKWVDTPNESGFTKETCPFCREEVDRGSLDPKKVSEETPENTLTRENQDIALAALRHSGSYLQTLPTGLRVEGSLNLTGATRLVALPADLRVEGDLNLTAVTGLEAFPTGLRVERSLSTESEN